MFTWNPYPEGRATILAFGCNANLATAIVGNKLADAQTQTCALYKIIQLYKAVEYFPLVLLGYASTGIFAVDVQAFLILSHLLLITNLYMPLLGIFDGIGNKVGYYLLGTSAINGCDIGGVGTLYQEFYFGVLDALCQRGGHAVKTLGKVGSGGLDDDVATL